MIKKIFSKFKTNIKVKGKNNKIILTSEHGEKEIHSVHGFKISITGNNNTIKIPKDYNISGNIKITTDNCLIDIMSTKFINLTICTHDQAGQKLFIGPKTSIIGATFFLNEKDASVIIGENCLFSGNIAIWATDGHSILDKTTKEILNPIKSPIVIEDNCWIGFGCILTKNTYLSSNSVVGAGSVVTKKFNESNVVIAGNPAKVKKTGISWDNLTPALLKKTRLKENI